MKINKQYEQFINVLLYYSAAIVSILGGSMFVYLFFHRLKETSRFPRDYFEIIGYYDAPFMKNVLFMGCFLLIAITISILYQKIWKPKWNTFICVFFTIGLFLVCMSFLFDGSGFSSGGDPLFISKSAAGIVKGDYSSFEKGGYLQIYPHQKGLALFGELNYRLFGIGNDTPLYVLQAIGVCFLYVVGYFFIKKIMEEKDRIWYLVLFPICTPFIISTCFIYGECIAAAFCLLAILSIMNFEKNKIWILVGCLSTCLALLCRSNSLIIFIAILIIAFLYSCKTKQKKVFLIALLFLCVSLFGKKIVSLQYEMRTGIEEEKGMPTNGWLLMGASEGVSGNGWYNYLPIEILGDQGYDGEKAEEVFAPLLRERIGEFFEHPKYAYDFYKKKILSQWNEATIESLLVLRFSIKDNTFSKTKEKLLFYENYEPFIQYMEFYQTVIYFGGICYAISIFVNRKNKYSLYLILPMVIFIGCFLFQIIWEAKSRYILFYMPFVIMGASIGYADFMKFVNRLIREKKRRK